MQTVVCRALAIFFFGLGYGCLGRVPARATSEATVVLSAPSAAIAGGSAGLGMDVEATLHIARGGSVGAASATSTNDALARCVAAHLETWTLPGVDAGTTVTVPLLFRAQEAYTRAHPAAFDRSAAAAALGSVPIAACKQAGGPTGVGHVTLTFGSSGAVLSAAVDGPPLNNSRA